MDNDFIPWRDAPDDGVLMHGPNGQNHTTVDCCSILSTKSPIRTKQVGTLPKATNATDKQLDTKLASNFINSNQRLIPHSHPVTCYTTREKANKNTHQHTKSKDITMSSFRTYLEVEGRDEKDAQLTSVMGVHPE